MELKKVDGISELQKLIEQCGELTPRTREAIQNMLNISKYRNEIQGQILSKYKSMYF